MFIFFRSIYTLTNQPAQVTALLRCVIIEKIVKIQNVRIHSYVELT